MPTDQDAVIAEHRADGRFGATWEHPCQESLVSNSRYHGLMLIGMLMAAHGVYWFLGGRAHTATDLRNAAVGVQIAIGLAVAVWAWWRTRRLAPDRSA